MDFYALSATCAPGVAPETMAAIVRTESGFKPLAIGINGGGRLERQPANLSEAVATAKWLIANGYNIDMGLGQINSANLRRLGLGAEDVFDPCKNLAGAARILQENYRQAAPSVKGGQAALQEALSAYNTGNFRTGFNNGYVRRVVNSAAVLAGSPIRVLSAVMKEQSVVSGKKQEAVAARPQGSTANEIAEDKMVKSDDTFGDIMVYR